jgi:hypothetical protein
MNSTPSLPSVFARVALAAVVVVSLLATPGIAFAQCPPIPAAEFAIDKANTVFVGRVVAVEEQGTVAEMRVLSIWKGRDIPETVEVRGSAGAATSGSDARRFEVGRNYLVIPENSRDPYLATACSATQAYAAAPGIIPTSYQEAAGAAKGRPPIAVDSNDDSEEQIARSILPLLGLIGLIGVAWAVIRRLRSLQPERAGSFATGDPTQSSGRGGQRLKRRSLQRDVGRSRKVARRTVRRHGRGLRSYRRRQNRQVASSRKPRR